MRIDAYADVVCPWCLVGEKRLEKALRRRPNLKVERRWSPFQLRPKMPAEGVPWGPFALEKFGGEANMRAAFESVAAAGAPDGVRFDFERIASAPNTVDAHRLILFARERGREWETADALFVAYFTGGADLNDRERLATVGAGAGLDGDEAREYLAGDGGVAEVWASQEEAGRVGVSSVPFHVFDGRYAVSGAQPAEVFEQALDAALAGQLTRLD